MNVSSKLLSCHLMTGLQESLFAYDANSAPDAGNLSYIEQFSVKLNGQVDLDILAQSWCALAERYAALRTAFMRSRDGRPVQAVLSERNPDIRKLDPEVAGPIEEFARTERARPFDLQRDPLLRIVLIPMANDGCEMIVTFHHIILDAWSAPTLIEELMGLFAHAAHGAPKPAMPSPSTPGVLADSQKARRGETCKAYWRAALGGSEIAVLPIIDAAVPPGLKSTVIRKLPSSTAGALHRFAGQQGVTASAVLHALWGVVLARLSHRDDVVFATVIANRSHDLPQIERGIGLFAATLPVRVNLSKQTGFADLCVDMQAQLRDAVVWSALPLAEVLSAGGLRADQLDHTMMGRPAALSWGDADALEFAEAGITLCDYRAQSWDHYDFQMGFSLGDAPYVEARHDVDRVPEQHVEMVLALTLDLLDRVLADPKCVLQDIAICEREAMQAVSANAGFDQPVGPLHDILARGHPATNAVGDGAGMLSRADVQDRVAQVVSDLAELGVGEGHRVAIAAVQSAQFTVQVLACWHLGASFVPVNPAWPSLRKQAIIDTVLPKAILNLADVKLPTTAAMDAVEDDNGVAYCVFTSGSTGVPKGVLVSHAALATYCQSVAETFEFNAKDRALQVTSPAFDLGYTTAFGVLAAGGAVEWLSAQAATDPDLVLRTMAEKGVTVIKATPAYLHLLLSAPDLSRFADLTQWRLLILGGEAPDPDQIRRLAQLCPWLKLAFHYGPTEATIGCAFTAPRPIAEWRTQDMSQVGCPVSGANIRILDRSGNVMPQGIEGEIAVGGRALARGYLIPSADDGFAKTGGQRFYLTGDLGKIDQDGALHLSGRRDGGVKIRGHRVDPEQTRLALLQHALINAAAVGIRGQGVTAQLVAFVRMGDGPRDPSALRAFLAQHLPDVQIPQSFVFLSRLLMTENGKTDTAAMMAAVPDMPARQPQDTSAMTPSQRQIARIWSQVLGVEHIGPHDDFFELGGHSLRAIEVCAVVERETGVRLPLRWFFDSPVLADFTARLDAIQTSDPSISDAAIMRLIGSDDAAQMLCLPGLMGNSGIYREWLGELAPEWSVDGVDDLPALDAAGDVPTMARWILNRAPQNGREYRIILGWSFGADLAFEVACQLVPHGVVPLVVLLDHVPAERAVTPCNESSEQLETRRYWSQTMAVLSAALSQEQLAEYQNQFTARSEKQKTYAPSCSQPCPVVAVLADADCPNGETRSSQLEDLFDGPVRILTSGGNHFSMFHPPHLARWTAPLRKLMAGWLCDDAFPPNAADMDGVAPVQISQPKSELEV